MPCTYSWVDDGPDGPAGDHAASLTNGDTYWVALLGTGGTLTFRDGSASGCRSEGSRSSTLTTLPSTWATGATWGTCSPSAYATS